MTQPDTTYTMAVEKELILLTITGKLSVEDTQTMHEEVMAVMATKRGPKDILVNIEGAVAPSQDSLRKSTEFVKTAQFRRMAVYGNPMPGLTLLAAKILRSGGNNEKLKIFREERLARAWLTQSGHPVRAKLQKQTKRLRRAKEED